MGELEPLGAIIPRTDEGKLERRENPSPTPGTKATRTETPTWECEVCHDQFFVREDVPVGHPNFGRALPCDCYRESHRQEIQENLLRSCALPPGGREMTFETFKVRPGLQAAYEAAAVFGQDASEVFMLTLAGRSGAGKTHLGIAIAQRWLGNFRVARYVHAGMLLADLRAGFSSNREGYEERKERYQTAPLLVLDDLGAEKTTDWAQEQLDMLIDYRYMQRLHTVVTTNLRTEDLPERIASRLQDTRFGVTVGIQASDYRKTRGKA